jgi:tetratricopeptide (TPR) repeat protein
MFRRKSWGAVTEYLNTYVNQPEVSPKDRSQRGLLVAQLFEDFGKRLTAPAERATAQGYFENAAKLLEAYANDNPSGQMKLASFYARLGRLPEAIKLLQQHAEKADTPQLVAAALTVITAEKISDQQLQEVESTLTAVASSRKQPVPVLMALGVLKITRGQVDQAEAYYRQIIASDPNNFPAYNTLAVLLALTAKDDKKTDEALRLINHAIELAGSLPALLDSRAVVRIKRGEPQRALEDLDVILADTPEKIDPVWLFHKALALNATGSNHDEARDVMATARKEPYNLDRSKIDGPERKDYDKLIEDLKE